MFSLLLPLIYKQFNKSEYLETTTYTRIKLASTYVKNVDFPVKNLNNKNMLQQHVSTRCKIKPKVIH